MTIEEELSNLYCEEIVQECVIDYAGEVAANLIWSAEIYQAILAHCANQPEIEAWIAAEYEALDGDECGPDQIWCQINSYIKSRWPHLAESERTYTKGICRS